MNKILEFKGSYAFLSNFYPCNISFGGLTFKSAEAAYQASKFASVEHAQLFTNYDARTSKKEGGPWGSLAKQGTLPRPDWEQIKYLTMDSIVLHKFQQNPHLAKLLLETGDAILEEGNNWKDTTWGICPPGSNNGLNWLGVILMNTRKELKGRLS